MGRLLRMVFVLMLIAAMAALGWVLINDLPADQQRTTLPVTQGVGHVR